MLLILFALLFVWCKCVGAVDMCLDGMLMTRPEHDVYINTLD